MHRSILDVLVGVLVLDSNMHRLSSNRDSSGVVSPESKGAPNVLLNIRHLCTIHNTSNIINILNAMQGDIDIYSASQLEQAVLVCFFEYQITGPLPM